MLVVRKGDNSKVIRIASTGVAIIRVSTQTAGAEWKLQIKEIEDISA